jgi:hypothetical protein
MKQEFLDDEKYKENMIRSRLLYIYDSITEEFGD